MKKLKTGRRAKRSFTPEFRADAVRLVVSGKSATQVAKDLDLTETTLREWVRRAPGVFRRIVSGLRLPALRAALAEHHAEELGVRDRELDVRPPHGLEARDRRRPLRPTSSCTRHRADHLRRQLTEAEGRHRRHQRGLVVEVPVGGVRRDPDFARGLAQAERGRSARLDQPDSRRHERIAEVAVVVAVAMH